MYSSGRIGHEDEAAEELESALLADGCIRIRFLLRPVQEIKLGGLAWCDLCVDVGTAGYPAGRVRGIPRRAEEGGVDRGVGR